MSRSARPGLRGRGIRMRLTVTYMALFVACGVGLLTLTVLLAAIRVGHTESAGRRGSAAQDRIAALQAQLDQAHAAQFQQLLVAAAVSLLVMLAVSAVLGRTVAGRVLRPLRAITATTRRISADNLHQRLAVTTPQDEVKDLADTIDALLERLDVAFAAQRRFAANASHELRTPLATMRAAIDVATAKPAPIPATTTALADRIRTELDRVDELLTGLLQLARIQHASPPEAVTVPVADLVSASLAARAADIADKGLTVHQRLDADALVHGSGTLLARMVDNVIDNAVTHNRRDGWIDAAASVRGATAVLVVETGGRRLDPDQVGRLAQPFQRLGAERTSAVPGSGLGLSIVAAVATAHHGRLDLTARPEGGLRVTIALPLAAAPIGVPA